MSRIKDRTGKKYGRLTFVRPTDQRDGGRVVWEMLCDCGNTIYKRYDNVVNGGSVSCGCKLQEIKALIGTRSVRKHHPRISVARQRWACMYRDCNFDLFLKLSQQPCAYCGRGPHRTSSLPSTIAQSEYQKKEGVFTYNGLDRVDNTKGHTEGNVVPCCWTCNHMKGQLTREEFIAHIERVYNHSRTIVSPCSL
jgi:hypothetical protein